MQKLNRIKIRNCVNEVKRLPRKPAESFFDAHARSHDSNLLKRSATAHTVCSERKKMLQFFFLHFFPSASKAMHSLRTKLTRINLPICLAIRVGASVRWAVLSLTQMMCRLRGHTINVHSTMMYGTKRGNTEKFMSKHFPQSSHSDSQLLRSSFSCYFDFIFTVSFGCLGERLVWVMWYGHLFLTKAHFLRTIFYVSQKTRCMRALVRPGVLVNEWIYDRSNNCSYWTHRTSVQLANGITIIHIISLWFGTEQHRIS